MTSLHTGLPDLDEAHRRHQSRLAKIRVGNLLWYSLAGLLAGLLSGLGFGGVEGILVGGLVALAWGGIVALPLLVGGWREGRHPGPASRGPSSLGRVRTTAPGDEVWTATYHAAAAAGFGVPRPIDAATAVASRPLSGFSWGATMFIRQEPGADGRLEVLVWCRPDLVLQLTDYGQCRKAANAVLSAVPGGEPVA